MGRAAGRRRLIVDLRIDDPRVDEIARLGLPAVVVGGPPGRALPRSRTTRRSVVVEAVRYLAALGHTRIGRVAGVSEFVHTTQRTEAFREVVRDLGLWARGARDGLHAESGARATRRFLSTPEPPTAIVYDSDLLAVTGLGVAQHMGFSVPDDLSIVGWDDSLISQVVHPPLTAITRDIQAYGVSPRSTCSRSSTGATSTTSRRAAGSYAARSTGRAPMPAAEPYGSRRPART